METFDEKVQRAFALADTVDTVKETQCPAEINGVRIYPCDDYGRIPEGSPVEYIPTAPDGYPNTPKGSDDAAQAVEGKGLGTAMADYIRATRSHVSHTMFGDAEVTTVKKTRLYTAGCISGDDRPFDEKAKVFYDGADRLRTAGYDAVNPLDIGNDQCFHGADTCSDNTLRRLKGKDQGAGHSWECYLRHDLIEVLQCDGVALLPGWEQSPGARMEMDVATRVGIPAKPIDDWLDRESFVHTDPGGHTVRGYRDGASVHITAIETDLVGGRIETSNLRITPNGIFRKSTCDLCGKVITRLSWMDDWLDDGDTPGQRRICPASKAPDPVHVPERKD